MSVEGGNSYRFHVRNNNLNFNVEIIIIELNIYSLALKKKFSGKNLPKIKEKVEYTEESSSCNQRSARTHSNTPLLRLANKLYCFAL